MNKVVNNEELLNDAAIKQKVRTVWAKVFEESNRVIRDANKFGYFGMEVIPSPNIHEILVQLKVISCVLEVLIGNAESIDIDYDEIRLLINAKEQILRMERVAAALHANNRIDFDEAIERLENQAPF